ncbi:MAG: DUF542 domain-containing protein [Terriglobia bacterium]
MSIDVSKLVKDLVAELPNAARVFEQMGIDSCCGGAKRLEEACRAANVRAGEVLQALEEANAKGRESPLGLCRGGHRKKATGVGPKSLPNSSNSQSS